MQTETLLRIPFSIVSGNRILEGIIKGNHLQPYEIYEVRLSSGEIVNMEAIPLGEDIRWFSFQYYDWISTVGREIENRFRLPVAI